MTMATTELAQNKTADGHAVFFMKPVMFTYRTLSSLVDPSVKAVWDSNLQTFNPYSFGFPTNNWGLVGTLDMLRTDLITHFGSSDWWKAMLDYQLGAAQQPVTLTPNGMYQDHTGADGLNPLPYDTFPISGYLTVMIKEGYNGTHAPLIAEATRRGAWTHMLMQSPWGEIPTGGRSSQHTWNEAVSALAYEIFAAKYNAEGDAQAACMFKRAAHLSFGSVKRWQNPSGALQIVKNHFNASLRWGYEDYSYVSNYNLLPASMVAAAFMYADESITECPTFADVGGFAIELPEHHLVIANAGGVYTEIETSADPNYDPMGLHRVHINTCGVGAQGSCVSAYTHITPTAGPPFFTGEGTGIAIGPWWSTADAPANRTSFAGLNYLDVAAISVTPNWGLSSTNVAFSVEYFLLVTGAVVTQSYNISVNVDGSKPLVAVTSSVQMLGGKGVVARAASKGVSIPASHMDRARERGVFEPAWLSSPSANMTRFGTQFPIFLFDGASNSTVAVDDAALSATVSGPASWGSAVFSLAPPQSGHQITLTYDASAIPTVSRNGLMNTLWAETNFDTASPSMTQYVTAMM